MQLSVEVMHHCEGYNFQSTSVDVLTICRLHSPLFYALLLIIRDYHNRFSRDSLARSIYYCPIFCTQANAFVYFFLLSNCASSELDEILFAFRILRRALICSTLSPSIKNFLNPVMIDDIV